MNIVLATTSPPTMRGHRSRRITSAVLSIVLLFPALVALAPAASASTASINTRRSGSGLSSLTDSGGLASMAAEHSRAMAAKGALFHSTGLLSRVQSVLPSAMGAGENVGVGSSEAEVDGMFWTSPEHRSNILGNYTHVGVGSFTASDGRVWVTQMFGRVDSAPRVVAPAPAPVDDRVAATRPTVTRVSRSARRVDPPAPLPTVEPRWDPAPRRGVVGATSPSSPRNGFLLFAADGGVTRFGDAPLTDRAPDVDRAAPVVAGRATPTREGYLLFGADGGVFAVGDATFEGSAADADPTAPITGADMTPTGKGYVLFGADGGTFAFGDAPYAGSLAATDLNSEVVDGALTRSDGGYWLATEDGGVFALGDAPYEGSLVGQPLNAPITAIRPTPTAKGYWLLGADGGVYAFGDAGHFGSAIDSDLKGRANALVPTATGLGYRVIDESGAVFPFGDAVVADNFIPLRGIS